MKLVVVSDLHPDTVTMGVPRFAEVEKAVAESVKTAVMNKADVFIFLGDLADPESQGLLSLSQALLIRTALELQVHGIKFIAIPGNHDVHEDGTGATTLTPLTALDTEDSDIYIAETVRLIYIAEKLAVLCLPFIPVSHGVDLDKAVREVWPHDGTRVIAISHLTVPGVIPGSETTDMPRGREIGYPFDATKEAILRLQGHYHRHQDFDPEDGGPAIIIPGSLARLTFGEEENTPSYLIVEV